MAESIKKQFDSNGSPLAVPVSPANGVTPEAVSIVGNSKLHNQYSNIGDPELNKPAYTNPSTSQLGEATEAYQKPVNRYKSNAPEGRSF